MSDGAVHSDPQAPLGGREGPPARIPFGKFEITCLLGEGGMARVYRAVLSGSMGFQKLVALKRIDPRMTKDERFVKALVNEARLGGQLHHRNIVEIYEFSQVENQYYMAMEYVDGWTLNTVLSACRRAKKWVPPSVVGEIVAGVCEGLRYAHSASDNAGQAMNLVHRDLKPGNLILSRSGDVKILDFGIAKADTNLYQTTDATSTKGTPVYMSPEQVVGEALDKRSDLFSLGAVLHELLTLQVPFPGDNVMSVMHGIVHGSLERPMQRVAARAPEFVPMLERLMANAVDARCADAAEAARLVAEARSKIGSQPTLIDWLTEMAEVLPPRPLDGDYGEEGPPSATSFGPPADANRTRTVELPKKQRIAKAPPKKKTSPMALVAGVAVPVAVLVVLMASGVLEPTAESAPTPAPMAAKIEPSPAPPPVVEPTPVPVVAAPVEAAPTPAPRGGARESKPPAKAPEKVVEAAPVGTGFVDFNSQPWSNVTVDGRALGMVPQRNVELSAGSHTVVFHCTVCKPEQSKTVSFIVRAGERTKETASFGQ
jgi:serine/threonine-protein kinase